MVNEVREERSVVHSKELLFHSEITEKLPGKCHTYFQGLVGFPNETKVYR